MLEVGGRSRYLESTISEASGENSMGECEQKSTDTVIGRSRVLHQPLSLS